MSLKKIAWLGILGLALMSWFGTASYGQDAPEGETTPAAAEPEMEEAAEPVTPEAALAAAEEVGWALDNVWLILCGALVMMMQLGFGCLEAGFLPQKHTVNVLMKNVMDFSLGAIVFFFIGFSIMYNGTEGGWIGFNGFGIGGFAPAEGETFAEAGAGYSHYSDWFFQVVFAAAAATIASGAMAGRTAFRSYLIYTIFITGLIYPISGYWKWGGGWLAQAGFADFAGSMVVHGCGGFVALAGAILLGPRIGRFKSDGSSTPIPGHSMSLAFVGTLVLFFGWFGFNAGSELTTLGGYHGTDDADSAIAIGQVVVTTLLSAAGGCSAAMFLTWAITSKPDLGMAMNGILGGLVGVTANTDQVSPESAILIGIVAGVIVVLGTILLDKIKIDDPVGAFPVHGLCGLWGCIACGIFGMDLPTANAETGELMSRGQYIGVQVMGSVVIALWAFLSAMVIFGIIKVTIGLRATKTEELEGLDITEHGAEAYPDYSLRIH